MDALCVSQKSCAEVGRTHCKFCAGFWGLFWMLLGGYNHRAIYIPFSWRVHHRKGFAFFCFFFFYHLGQEAVWFDIGSNFIFKQNMRNTGEETTLCSLELVEEKTGLQKYSLMHTLDGHVPWLTQHWGALGVQQDCAFSSKGGFFIRFQLLGLRCPVVHLCVSNVSSSHWALILQHHLEKGAETKPISDLSLPVRTVRW